MQKLFGVVQRDRGGRPFALRAVIAVTRIVENCPFMLRAGFAYVYAY